MIITAMKKEEDHSVSYCYTSAGDWLTIFMWLSFAVITAVSDAGEETAKSIFVFLTTLLSLLTAVLKINAQGVRLDFRSRTITFLSEKKKPKNISDIQKIVHTISDKGRDEVKVFIDAYSPKDFKIAKEEYKDFISRISRLNPGIEIVDVPYDERWW